MERINGVYRYGTRKKTKKKKKSTGIIAAAVIVLIIIIGVVCYFLFAARSAAGLLEKTWKDADADTFRALFVDELPEGVQEAEQEESGNIRYLSDAELESILNGSAQEAAEAPDLLKTMMELGSLSAKKDGENLLTVTITVPDLPAILEGQELSGTEDISWLIGLVQKLGKDSPMHTQTVSVEYARVGKDICYLISNDLLDAVYASLPSDYSEALGRYYEAIGKEVKEVAE